MSFTVAIPHVIGAWIVNEQVNPGHQNTVSCYCTAEIRNICMILYIQIMLLKGDHKSLCESLVPFDKVFIV